MKKTLLSAVLCGFVLNNGYCFDEEHKITEEYLNKSFCERTNVDVNYLNDRLKEFGTEFIESIIPIGENEGEAVKNLLKERKLCEDTLLTICDCSVRIDIINSGIAMSVVFELGNGEKIEINAAPSLTDDCDNDETKGFRVFLHSKTYTTICAIKIDVE